MILNLQRPRRPERPLVLPLQEVNIKEQLDAGVRYLDLRIARKPKDPDPNRLYFYHGLYTRSDVEVRLDLLHHFLHLLHLLHHLLHHLLYLLHPFITSFTSFISFPSFTSFDHTIRALLHHTRNC